MTNKQSEQLRVAIYIRVSTKMQEDRYSLSAQKLELTRYAEQQGWTIVDTYQDVDSGTKLEKDGLEAMLDSVEDGLVDVVLCIEQDRLSRLDTVKWEYLKGVLRDNGVRIAEPGHMTNLDNIDDEFFSDLKNLLAQRSRKDLLRKLMRGKRQFTREGKVWGKQPDEYIYDAGTGELTINEERAWVIPFIDDLYLNKGLGVTGIARELNKKCKTVNGKKWTRTQVLQRLTRKAYHGVLEKQFRSETISIPDVYPKLRTEETYNAITAMRKKRFGRKPAEPHMLRDIDIRCAACGKKVSVAKTIAQGKKKEQRYDIFVLRHTSDDTLANCPVNPYMNTKRITNNLIKAVKEILTDEEHAKRYIGADLDDSENELELAQKEVKKLQKKKADINEKVDKLLDLYLDSNSSWPKEKLDANKKKLDAQLEEIEKELSVQQRKMEMLQNNQFNYDAVFEFLSIVERFEVLLTTEQQQKQLGVLFPTATIDVEKHVLTLHALLPQNVTLDINIDIETMEETTEREILESAEIRYKIVQAYLDDHLGLALERLAKETGYNPQTLKKDQERFGPFRNIAPNRLSVSLREERIEMIKQALSDNKKLSGRELERRTGLNRKMIYRLIKEYNLR